MRIVTKPATIMPSGADSGPTLRLDNQLYSGRNLSAPLMSLALGLAAVSADTAGEGVSRTIFGLSQLVSGSAESVRTNKTAAHVLSRRIDDIVQEIASSLEHDPGTASDEKWVHALNTFVQSLRDTHDLLKAQAARAFLSQVLHREEDKRNLELAASNIENAFDILKVHAHARTSALISASTRDGSSLLRELQALPMDSDSGRADFSPQLPHKPALFFGRETETQGIVNTVARLDPAHVAILGGPGFGKTALAISVLYHPDVVARFALRRYFVPCDAAEGPSECLRIIAGQFGILGTHSQTIRRALRFSLGEGPSLLLLDNFESAWEAGARRAEAEELLQFLAGIPTVSLIITLRGAERPQNVAWSRPFLAPLAPLGLDAAKQVFLSVADAAGTDDELSQLLAHVENIPLGVNLLANLAQYETISALLARWETERTSMLSGPYGTTPRTSLDLSIHLSIHCARMQACAGALALLRLLALLPNGVIDSEVALWSGYDYQALATLLRVSLAVRTPEQRIYVLAPIRSFVQSQLPPSDEDLVRLYTHYFALAATVRGVGGMSSRPEDIDAVMHEISNIESLIEHALDGNAGMRPAVQATADLCRLYLDTGLGSASRLLGRALESTRVHGMEDLTVELLILQGWISHNTGRADDASSAAAEAQALATTLDMRAKIFDAGLLSLYFSSPDDGAALLAHLRTITDVQDDPVRSFKWHGQAAEFAKRRGSIDEALSIYNEAVRAYRAKDLREERLYALMLTHMGELHLMRGEHMLARTSLEDAATVFDTIQYAMGGAYARLLLGHLHLQQGHLEKAIHHLSSASGPMQKWGSRDVLLVHALLCEAHLAQDDPDEARTHVHFVQRFQQEMGWGKIYALMCRGALALHLKDAEEVRAILTVMESEWRSRTVMLSDHFVAGEIATLHGSLAQELEDDRQQACQSFILALVARAKLGTTVDVAITLLSLAEVSDDATSLAILDAVMLPLARFGYDGYLARALMQSARLAKNVDVRVARHRANSARKRYQCLGDVRGMAKTATFLVELDVLSV